MQQRAGHSTYAGQVYQGNVKQLGLGLRLLLNRPAWVPAIFTGLNTEAAQQEFC